MSKPNGKGNKPANPGSLRAEPDTANVQEDVLLDAGGNVLANDTGANLTVTTAGTFAGTYGTLVLNADGSYAYTLDNGSPLVQALAQGQTVTDVFNYTVAGNGKGKSASSTLTVTVIGTDDAPVVSGLPSSIQTSENTAATISANSVTDIDARPGEVFTLNMSAAHGTLSAASVPPGANVTEQGGADGLLQISGSLSAIDSILSQGVNYTPDAGFAGQDTVAASVTDGYGLSDTHSVAVTVAQSGPPTSYTFQTLDDPLGVFGSQAMDISDDGHVVGTYFDASDVAHGFLYDPGAQQFTTIDVPGAQYTVAQGINNSGSEISGYYVEGNQDFGFTYQPGVGFTSYQVAQSGQQTIIKGVNDSGDIVGYDNSDAVLFQAGTLSTYDHPGAASTGFHGINDVGQIVGTYIDFSGTHHAFLDDHGAITEISDPQSAGIQGTDAEGINQQGQIVGGYSDGSTNHAFIYTNGSYLNLDDPNAAAPGGTLGGGINNSSQIVGWYWDAHNTPHGYLATPTA